jgi:hypothetical protein
LLKDMSIELEKLKAELMELPLESRAILAQSLIDSLDEAIDPDADELWLAEVGKRDLEIRNGTAKTTPVNQVLRDARNRLQCLK